jgi:branched-chain amino acid transport system permease protein
MVALVEQGLLSGLTFGIIATLIALGFTLVLGILNISNFAHGNQVMVAMYLALVASRLLGINPFGAAVVIAPLLFLLGLVIYWLIVRALVDKPHTTQVAATIGLMILLENVVNLFFGGTTQNVPQPFSVASVPVLSTYVATAQLVAAGVAAVAIVLFTVLLTRTDFGLAMRACADNLVGARVSGLATGRIFAIAFGLSVGAAGLAGAALASFQPMTPSIGAGYLSMAFAVVILAGAGNTLGTIASGLVVGLLQSFSQIVFSASIGDTVLFLIIILALFVKPEGLFARR